MSLTPSSPPSKPRSDRPAPPPDDRRSRILLARCEIAYAIVGGWARGDACCTPAGFVGSFRTRDAARCAATLLDELLDHVSVSPHAGGWRVAGAFRRAVLAAAA